MNLENPTQVQIGMTGQFLGKPYRVVGRALLGETEFNRVDHRTEYYLETPGEDLATLVYEETTLGSEWRWFTMFDPKNPLTAAEAATKGVGSTVNLDGADTRVTLVQESRVYHTEGQTPEGVKPGAQANYFNAEAGQRLEVVSWTGEEMEFYRGTNLAVSVVAAAFNLRAAELVKFPVYASSSKAPLVKVAIGVAAFAAVLIFVLSLASRSGPPPAAATVARFNAPASPLNTGRSGVLEGTNYQLEGHAVVEIAEVGRVVTHHEYFLRDAAGNEALLIYGWSPGAKDWRLFLPAQPATPLTPGRAGNVRLGQTVKANGVTAPVDELFRSTVLQSEGWNEPGSAAGDVRYGFSARSGDAYVLARWNEDGIVFREGKKLPEQDVTEAFDLPVEK